MEQQEKHRESSEKEGLIVEYLEKPIPENWYDLDLSARRMFLNGSLQGQNQKLMKRGKVCAYEIWEECCGMDKVRVQRRDSNEIISVMKRIKGWARNRDKRRYGPYGAQRGFERI